MESICKDCINYFDVVYDGYTLSYCKQNIEVRKHGNVLVCPFHKPKAMWKKVDEQIKEEPKHIKRINRQRKRFDDKIIKKGNKGVLMHLDGKRR